MAEAWHTREPTAALAILTAAACVIASVTFRIDETDFWQHLLVGRAIATLHRVPTTQQWSWPTFGAPDVNYAWGFDALIFGFWKLGGTWGLFAWRWLTTLGIFAALWAAARRMGARGASSLVVMVGCALVYRQRSQVRPETLAALLLALELWILEARRHGGRDRTAWLIPIQWLWVNVHLTHYVGFALIAFHAFDGWGRARTTPSARRLLIVAAAAFAISFVNPFGWRALWEPLRFVLESRGEPLYRAISELAPVDWNLNRTNGLMVLVALWPVLFLWRARRGEFDRVEALGLLFFVSAGLAVQKFIGNLAVAAAPFVARDLDEWIRSRNRPVWSAAPLAGSVLAAAACIAISLPELTRPDSGFGVGIDARNYPLSACDYIAARGVRGRLFNHFRLGGYLLWRFWPERDRLPFIDIHQAGTPAIRRGYLGALRFRADWEELDRQFRFEQVLLARPQIPGDNLPDFLDADPRWALVFVDDAAALYLRRDGVNAEVASRDAYSVLGAGAEKLEEVAASAARDSALRTPVAAELGRQIASSPACALSHSFLANLYMSEHRPGEARDELDRALAIDPGTPEAHLRLGTLSLASGRPAEALREFAHPGAAPAHDPRVEFGRALACMQLGDTAHARAALLRVLKRDPANAIARRMLSDTEGGASSR